MTVLSYKPAEKQMQYWNEIKHGWWAITDWTEKSPIMMHNKPESNDGRHH